MSRSKVIIVLAIVLLTSISVFSQSFTYSGPTNVTILFGNSNVNANYYFSYQNLGGLCYPCLVVSVDNQVISNSLCDNPSTPSYFTIGFTPGDHSVKFKLLSINCQTLNCYNMVIHQEVEFTVTCKFQISVENIFGGGSIYADGNGTSPVRRTSVSGDNVSIGGIEQSYGGYNWIWNTNGTYNSEWSSESSYYGNSSFSTSQNTSYSVRSNDLNTAVIAGLRKVCNLELSSPGGYVYVVGSGSHSSPYTAPVVEQNTIYATGQWYSSNYIDYTFDHWDNNPSSNTITATAHNTYTAVYVGRPTNTGEYASAGGTVGQPIIITWTDNPNTAVTEFQIWRRVKHNGVTGDPVLLTTVGRGVQTYTDNDYILTNGYTDDLLWYDVRAYYSTEGTYSDPNYCAQFGMENYSREEDKPDVSFFNEMPTDYSIANYPNPFNPTTTINYQLPENGFVTIKVYDLLGKEVATLVNENKSAGYHRVNFDASKLTSGVYVYTITANQFIQSKKMLLMK
jgi:hypothetical protein